MPIVNLVSNQHRYSHKIDSHTYDTDSKYVHIYNATSVVWQALNRLLRDNNVEHLDLEYSPTETTDGVEQALYEGNSLKSISLHRMNFYEKSLAYMINMLAERHGGLTKLTLGDYNSNDLFSSSEGRITDALSTILTSPACTLRSLQLDHICIDEDQDEHFAVFCDALARTSTLTSLRLVDVELSEVSTQRLKAALLSNQGITTFSLSEQGFITLYAPNSNQKIMETALKDVLREKPFEATTLALRRPSDDDNSASPVPTPGSETFFYSGINMQILSGFIVALGAVAVAISIIVLSGGIAAGVGLIGAFMLSAGVYGLFSSRQDDNDHGGAPTPANQAGSF